MDYILSAPLHTYVALNAPGIPPYDSWSKAATNIQHAVDYGVDGTTVWVSNGTYDVKSTIDLTAGVTVRGTNGAAVTILDGGGTANPSVLRCFFIQNADAVVDGFTIRNFNTFPSHDTGVGVRMFGGTVRDCVITNNDARDGSAAGVWNYGGLVENCVVMDNKSRNGAAGVTVANGGTVRNCLIARNTVLLSVGGLSAAGSTVDNCTISANTVTGTGGSVGGAEADATCLVRNTVIYGNTADSSANYNFSVFTAASNCCLNPNFAQGVACIASDPLFVNPAAGDFALQEGTSPCINAGINLSWMAVDTLDVVGKPRIRGTRVDIGAYEAYVPAGTLFMVR